MEKVELLIELALMGAVGEERRVTVRFLSRKLGTSPQSVLRLLSRLEEEGLLRRRVSGRKTHVELTEGALAYLEELYEKLGRALYNGLVVGEVVSGVGEGAYYVRLYSERFRDYLGFDPYPGTLNVRVLFPKTIFGALVNLRPVLIPGFVKNGRTFGDVKAYPVLIRGIEGAIVIPSRTVHPPEIAEVIAPLNLRERLGLRDGDRIRIEVHGR